MVEGWPPKGHGMWYTVQIDMDGHQPIEYEMTVVAKNVNIAGLPVHRDGGPDAADEELRVDLRDAVGAMAIAGGHAEAAMKRLILVCEEGEHLFDAVDFTWTELIRRIRGLTDEQLGSRAERVRNLMRRSERLKVMRDHVIHGSFWDYNVGDDSVILQRFRRKSSGETMFVRIDDIRTVAEELEMFASDLNATIWSEWGQARLPKRN